MPRRLPSRIGSDIVLMQPWQGHDRYYFARILVFGSCFYLVAVEIGHDVLWPCSGEMQTVPADRDLPGSDAEKAAKIDDRSTRPAGLVDEHVDNAAHRLAGSAADPLVEDAKQ